jgi:anti-anti-sigma factor
VAAFAVNLPIGAGVLPAAVTAVGNTLAPLMAAVLLLRVGFRRQLDRQRDALAIVFLGALASMLVSATIGAGTLAVSREIPISQLPTAWAVWWTDLSNARQVMESIAGAVPSEAALVVVDLSDTSYLDSAGIAMIFRLAERLGHRRQELRLVVPADSPVRGVIELTNVPGVVPVEEAILLAAEPG